MKKYKTNSDDHYLYGDGLVKEKDNDEEFDDCLLPWHYFDLMHRNDGNKDGIGNGVFNK